jgi:ABC-type glycerol-3-phosphate transport system permease component
MSKPCNPGVMTSRLARIGGLIGVYAIIGCILLPILWIVLTSFKTPRDVYTLQLWFSPTWDNFRTVFAAPGISATSSPTASGWRWERCWWRSRWRCGGLCVLALPFPGRQALFVGIVASQFIPAAIVVLPYFLMFRSWGCSTPAAHW